jgi:hypothetical protein
LIPELEPQKTQIRLKFIAFDGWSVSLISLAEIGKRLPEGWHYPEEGGFR